LIIRRDRQKWLDIPLCQPENCGSLPIVIAAGILKSGDTLEGYRIFEHYFSRRTIPNAVKIVLSVKHKKRRILISGQIDYHWEFGFNGIEHVEYKSYYFIPNNAAKFKKYCRIY
jgi:hypothetical protein